MTRGTKEDGEIIINKETKRVALRLICGNRKPPGKKNQYSDLWGSEDSRLYLPLGPRCLRRSCVGGGFRRPAFSEFCLEKGQHWDSMQIVGDN